MAKVKKELHSVPINFKVTPALAAELKRKSRAHFRKSYSKFLRAAIMQFNPKPAKRAA